MKRNFILIGIVYLLLACTNRSTDIVPDHIDENLMSDPQPMGLIPYDSISSLSCKNTFYSEYDSLYVYYDLKVLITEPSWPNRHDSLTVQRIKGPIDTNWWDCVQLYGKCSGDTQWIEVCQKIPFQNTDRQCYHQMLDLLTVIGLEIESRLFYFDEEDWRSNYNYYDVLGDRKNVEYSIRGRCRLR
jgi:hypothetical protein